MKLLLLLLTPLMAWGIVTPSCFAPAIGSVGAYETVCTGTASFETWVVNNGQTNYSVAVVLTGTPGDTWSASVPAFNCNVSYNPAASGTIPGSGTSTVYLHVQLVTWGQTPGDITCTISFGSGNGSINGVEHIVAPGFVAPTVNNLRIADSALGCTKTNNGYRYKDECTSTLYSPGATRTLPSTVGATFTEPVLGGVFTVAAPRNKTHIYPTISPFTINGDHIILYSLSPFSTRALLYDLAGNLLAQFPVGVTTAGLSIDPTNNDVFYWQDGDTIRKYTYSAGTITDNGVIITDPGEGNTDCDGTSKHLCRGTGQNLSVDCWGVYNTGTKIHAVNFCNPAQTVTANLSVFTGYATYQFKEWVISPRKDSSGYRYIQGFHGSGNGAGSLAIQGYSHFLRFKDTDTTMEYMGGIDNPGSEFSYTANSGGITNRPICYANTTDPPAKEACSYATHSMFYASGGDVFWRTSFDPFRPDAIFSFCSYNLTKGTSIAKSSILGGGWACEAQSHGTDYNVCALLVDICLSSMTYTVGINTYRHTSTVGNGVTTSVVFTDAVPFGAGPTAVLVSGTGTAADARVNMSCTNTTHCTYPSAYNGTATANTGVSTLDVKWAYEDYPGQEYAATRMSTGQTIRIAKAQSVPQTNSNIAGLGNDQYFSNSKAAISPDGTKIMVLLNGGLPDVYSNFTAPTGFVISASTLTSEINTSGDGITATPAALTALLTVKVPSDATAQSCVVDVLNPTTLLTVIGGPVTLAGGTSTRTTTVTGLASTVTYKMTLLCNNFHFSTGTFTTTAQTYRNVYFTACIAVATCTPPLGTVSIKFTVTSSAPTVTSTCTSSPCVLFLPVGATSYAYSKQYLDVSGNVIAADPIQIPLNMMN